MRLGKRIDRTAQSWESGFAQAARTVLEKDRRAVLARAQAAKALFLERKQSIDWTLIQRNWKDYFENEAPDNWREEFMPLVRGVTTDANEVWTAELGIQFNVQNLFEMAALEFEAYGMTFAQEPLDTTVSDLFSLLHTSADEGWTIEQLDRAIDRLWDVYLENDTLSDEERGWFVDRRPRYRVEMIARTETMHGANFGSTELFKAYGAGEHEWLCTIDGRQRPTHQAANGQVRTIGQPFEVGNSLLLYPTDGSLGADAAEVVNCRCTTVPTLEGIEAAPPVRQIAPTEQTMLNEIQETQAYMEGLTDEAMLNTMKEYLYALEQDLKREEGINKALWSLKEKMPSDATEQDWTDLANDLKRQGYELYLKYTREGIEQYVSEMRGAQASGYMVVGSEQIAVRRGAFSVREAQRLRGELWAQAKDDLSRAMGQWLNELGFTAREIAQANYDQRRRLLEELGNDGLLRTSSGQPSRIDAVPAEARERVLGQVGEDTEARAAWAADDPLYVPTLDAYGKMELADAILATKVSGGPEGGQAPLNF